MRLSPVFLLQFLAILLCVFFSMRIALRRFRWTSLIAGMYAVAMLGVYLFLSYLFRDEPWVRAFLIPDVIVLVGIGLIMVLSEQFWRQYRQVETQLIQAEKMGSLGQLVAGVAHELNTPLGAVKSNLDLVGRALNRLREQLKGNTTAQDAEKIFQTLDEVNQVSQLACNRMQTIVGSLRSFARLDQAELQKANLHEGIETTLTLINYQIKNRVQIVREFGDIPEVLCYPNRLNQVFMNILVNAAQAIEGNGEVRIRTYRNGEWVGIQITDTGVGIPSKDLKRIFDPGFTTKGVKVGTGLGLSICYQIIREHGGKIDVQSQAGTGTTVTITLPVQGP